uniref:Type I restriction-modification system, specificity subunit S (EC) n=1 Tax=uncultured Thiotrichaceae bacterium TaxID=298394 RepID=A0A6S6T9T2_9GAMM|nr:MAG: Type I restriction-modification system, specificity subunit S (EC [uncultured Thiotrichaceae bacterium]
MHILQTEMESRLLGELFASSRKKGKAGLPLMSVTLHNGLIVRNTLDRRTETSLNPDEHLLVKEGFIAYNMMRVWQGALGRADFDGLVSPAYVVLQPTGLADSHYAGYLFKSSRMIYLFWAYSYGLTKDRLRLYYNDFARIRVKIPPLPEQKKISKILSTWDKAISVTEQLLANSQQQKTALMQQLLTGKRRSLDFEGKWKEVTVGATSKCFSGGTPSKGNEEYYNGDIPWVTSGKLNDRFVRSVDKYISEEGLKKSSAKVVENGCILVAMYGATAGKVAINEIEGATINQAVLAMEPKSGYSNLFLFYLLEREMNKALKFAQGGQPNLNASIIKGLKIQMPSLSEQQKIAETLSTADREIETLQQKLTHLKQEKKALMQQLLTGKRRVTINPSEEMVC